MNKAELIKAMVKKVEEQNVPLTAKQMDAALSALVESVTDALKNEEKVVLPGFGMFGVRMRPARRGYNPLTGEHKLPFLRRSCPPARQARRSRMLWRPNSDRVETWRGNVPFSGAAARFICLYLD